MKLSSRPNSSPVLTVGNALSVDARPPKLRHFTELNTYSLRALEDELDARIRFCKAQGTAYSLDEKAQLESAQKELRIREREDPAAWMLAEKEWLSRNKVWSYFPDTGPLRRELYQKHLEFFRAGKTRRRRLACCANKVGKSSSMGGYEVTLHATGRYPSWWEGKRFDRPVLAWIANKSAKETRDINERILYGPPGDIAARGTGMIPSHLIVDVTRKPGVEHALEFGHIRHVSGGTSIIQSKQFESGRESFQGAPEVDVIWHDEECPKSIAEESLMRTMTCGGILMFTYTPIFGLTELTVELFDQAGIDIGALAVTVEAEAQIEERPAIPEDDIVEHFTY